LHGLETYIKATNPKLGVVRYADDFIVTTRDKQSLENQSLENAQNLIQAWMSKRGLELSALEDGNHINGKWL
jgi:RNA-directed DNA polymerase